MSDPTDSIGAVLSNTVSEINQLLEATGDPQVSQQLHCLRELYFDLWEASIKQQFDVDDEEYKETIQTLQDSEKAAKDAQDDISEVAGFIQKIADGAKAGDKLLQTGLQVAKYFP